MIQTIADTISEATTLLIDRFWTVVSYPLTADHRLFWLYLMTSLFLALFVYRKTYARKKEPDRPSFLSFLFPKKVWENPSAWLDLRFFILNELTVKALHLGLLTATMLLVFRVIAGPIDPVMFEWDSALTWKGMAVSLGYMIVAIVVTDFAGFYIHYLQHKIPFLWEFHKVHHSPEVMHPLSNFREHPLDNIAYSLGFGLAYGVLMGTVSLLFGYVPGPPEILGVPLFFFLFNVGGYHLRHSHIWLRWKGRWSMVFPSPAHHHVHHSCHPDHLDKNFAFVFPIWDVIFKTYHMPEDDRDVKFGIYGVERPEYTTIWKIYALPFQKLWQNREKDHADPAPEVSEKP